MIIMVDEPSKGILYGSTVAAPYIGKTFETVLPYLGVDPIYTEAEKEALAKQIPNYIGLATSNAKAYAESRGLAVEVIGDGAWITDQYPKSGEYYTGRSGQLILYAGAKPSPGAVAVPNVVGCTAAQANMDLLGAGLNVKFEGAGAYDGSGSAVVWEQYPAAGTSVAPGSVVRVELRYIKDLE